MWDDPEYRKNLLADFRTARDGIYSQLATSKSREEAALSLSYAAEDIIRELEETPAEDWDISAKYAYRLVSSMFGDIKIRPYKDIMPLVPKPKVNCDLDL
ncbi:MAG TPA: hypothetical protein PLK94_02090 [Alphaproteobacteria bacterium]|nr:hypothetical protein [Alphaproteobacteria bacterium]HOO50059.1 hypothetical protein [Alphaproteobacteria bacterium]